MIGAGFFLGAESSPARERRWRIFALFLWILPAVVIAVLVFRAPEKRTVTHLYHAAVDRWQARQDLYDGPTGMNYLPSFVAVFAPFHLFPRALADVLWRWAGLAGLALGLAGMCVRPPGQAFWRPFAIATLLMLPLCLGAVRNGQANAHFGALLLLAAWALTVRRWWLAAGFIAVAVALKPLGLAAAGLAFMAFPVLGWRLAFTVGLALALPFGLAPAAYAQSQFLEALRNLSQCAAISEHRFADLNGILRTFGYELNGAAGLAVRLLASALFAGACFLMVRPLPIRERALGWLAAAAGYLMLFNPMTEANSYAILAPPLALWACLFAARGRERPAWVLTGALATMSLLPNLVRPWLGNSFALLWHPSMTILFLAIVAASWVTPPAPLPAAVPQRS